LGVRLIVRRRIMDPGWRKNDILILWWTHFEIFLWSWLSRWTGRSQNFATLISQVPKSWLSRWTERSQNFATLIS
jgi:hypothetical protein